MFNEPLLKGIMTPENTIAIDDRESTFSGPNPHNGILIPAYDPDIDVQSLFQDDTALLDLMDWLYRPEVMKSKDVRTLHEFNIFSKHNNLQLIIK